MAWNLVLQYSGLGFMVVQGVVLVPLYLRFVGAAEFGVWLVANGVATWVAIIDPGVASLMQQRVSLALGSTHPWRARQIVGQGVRLTAGLAAGMLGVGSLAVACLLRAVDPNDVLPANVGGWMMFLTVAGTAAGMVAAYATAAGVALRNARGHTVVSMGAAGGAIVATIILLYSGAGVLALPLGVLLRGALEAGVGFLLVRTELASLPSDDGSAGTETELEVGILTWSSLEKFAGTLAATTDLFLVGRVFGAASVTSYAIMRRPVDMLSALISRSSGALIPTVAYLSGKQADADVNALVVGAGSRIVWLLGLGCLGTIVFLEPLIGLWVGREHYLGSQITALLALGLAAQVFSGAFANFLWASGAARVFLRVNTLLNVLIVAGGLVGISLGGVTGMLLGALSPRVLVALWLFPKLAFAALRIRPAGRTAIWLEAVRAGSALAVGLAFFWALEGASLAALARGALAMAAAVATLSWLSAGLRRDMAGIWPTLARKSAQP